MGVPTKITEPLQLYTSIEDMFLYPFDRYLATQDLNWFRKDYTGKEPKIESEALKKAEEVIMEEYFTRIDDRSLQGKFQKWFKISELTKAYNVIESLVSVMWEGFNDTTEEQELRIQYIMLLNKGYGSIKFKMPLLNSPSEDREELGKIYNQLQGIKTKIALIQNELKDDGKKEKRSLGKQLVMVETSLRLNYSLDSKTLTLSKWIDFTELMEEKAKQN